MIRIYGDYEDVIENVIKSTAKRLDFEAEDIDVEVSIADEEEIRTLNRETRNIDKVTDVLSFQNIENVSLPLVKEDYPDDINGEDDSVMLGEILICDEQAKRQAEEYGHSVEREIGFLTCHGMLHLLGFDHTDEEGEKEMNALCEEILTDAGYRRDYVPEEREEKPVPKSSKEILIPYSFRVFSLSTTELKSSISTLSVISSSIRAGST